MQVPSPKSNVPALRIRRLNSHQVNPDGRFVLYWMTAYRRTASNFALQRATEWARHLGKPLVVLSAVRLDYPWASERLHAFILDSMESVAGDLASTPVAVYSYVEPERGAGSGLLYAMGADASLIVTDDAPVFFLPAMTQKAAAAVELLVEAIDHNSLMPLASTDRVFLRAYDLRRYLQKELPGHILDTPDEVDLGTLPPPPDGLLDDISKRWPSPPPSRSLLPDLSLRRDVPATELVGGSHAGLATLDRFVSDRLGRYEERNHPDEDAASGLAPYLHFGNVSVHQVFAAVADQQAWTPASLADWATGARSGWWGMSPAAEGFLDQIVTWRELGYRAARTVPNNDRFDALPNWARATLSAHASDHRDHVYSLEEFDSAETHDPLWNAAQIQLRREGTIHNYMRMLWGKKIIEWTANPIDAHDIMFELNNRYAIDGRDPNSISGIHWVLGRYDRAWGPERSVFGTVRYMSSESAKRKLRLRHYQSKMLNT